MDRYKGKRFAGFVITCILLTVGFFYGPVSIFPTFAGTLGVLYGAYVGGQTYTDGKVLK